jgi:hypothetical protein
MQQKYPRKYKRINRDDLRDMLDDYDLNKENEIFVTKITRFLIDLCITEKKDMILDETSLDPKYFDELLIFLGDRVKIKIKDFRHIDTKTAIERDKGRKRQVGEEVIKRMSKFIEPKTSD